MEKAQNFAKALKELRKSKGISLEQISDFCKTFFPLPSKISNLLTLITSSLISLGLAESL